MFSNCKAQPRYRSHNRRSIRSTYQGMANKRSPNPRTKPSRNCPSCSRSYLLSRRQPVLQHSSERMYCCCRSHLRVCEHTHKEYWCRKGKSVGIVICRICYQNGCRGVNGGQDNRGKVNCASQNCRSYARDLARQL